tara:strand:+ start:3073 stop:3573 length:501 start_codon:yes stop_codon:yes gene_type:complete
MNIRKMLAFLQKMLKELGKLQAKKTLTPLEGKRKAVLEKRVNKLQKKVSQRATPRREAARKMGTTSIYEKNKNKPKAVKKENLPAKLTPEQKRKMMKKVPEDADAEAKKVPFPVPKSMRPVWWDVDKKLVVYNPGGKTRLKTPEERRKMIKIVKSDKEPKKPKGDK